MCAQAFIKLASCLACALHLLFFFFCFTRMCLPKRDSLRHVHTYIISSRWHKHAFPDDPLHPRWCNRDTALPFECRTDLLMNILKACQQWTACCASSRWCTVMVKISSSPALLPFVFSINDMTNTVPRFTPWLFSSSASSSYKTESGVCSVFFFINRGHNIKSCACSCNRPQTSQWGAAQCVSQFLLF